MNEEMRTLSFAQVDLLADLVARRLAALKGPTIRAPLPSEYRAEPHFAPYHWFDLSVEIDIGDTVLTLRDQSEWPYVPIVNPYADMEALAEGITMQVASARKDVAGLAELHATEKTVIAKIKRDGFNLGLVSVRFQPLSIRNSSSKDRRGAWVRVDMLDDLLLPHTKLIIAKTPRKICRELNSFGKQHDHRILIREMLADQDAALEIEAAAEHAITSVGRSVGEVAHAMVEQQSREQRGGTRVVLWGDPEKEHVSVSAIDGRIRMDATLGPLTWSSADGIVVGGVFPETLTMALVGRPLRTLVEHPLLIRDARIVQSVRRSTDCTEIQVEEAARPIGRAEMGGTACPTG